MMLGARRSQIRGKVTNQSLIGKGGICADIVGICVVLGPDMRDLIQHVKDDVGLSQIIGKVIKQSYILERGGYVLT